MKRKIVLSIALLTAATALTSCYGEQVCGEGQYPVKAVSGEGTTCIDKGQPPESGWTTYSPGQTPTKGRN